MKKKIIIAASILAVIFIAVIRISKNQPAVEQTVPQEVQKVTTQSVQDSALLVQSIQYPALTAGDQQITLTAGASGTITRLNFDLGDKIFEGKQLVIIDEIGNNSGFGENGLKSSAVQALELAVEQAEESLKLAKDNFEDDDSEVNKRTKEIAKLQLESAKTALNGALNARLVISPITGTITQKSVSLGDSVNIGQPIASISKTALTKVQFFVSKEELSSFKIGTKVDIEEDGDIIPGTIMRIAPQADPATKRFLVEAKPDRKNPLIIGSVINVSLEITRIPGAAGNLILPLSAITISQNENYIFTSDDGRAKKVAVEIIKVQGEFAEIKADASPDTEIIISGSKLVQDGDEISIQ